MSIKSKKYVTFLLVVSGSIIAFFFILHGFKGRQNNPKFRPFLKQEYDYYVYDYMAGHLHREHAKRIYYWDEHEKGPIVLQTNNLGFREDSDTSEQKAKGTVRILVTGDSHIDGVVNNNESFANQLEDRLNRGLTTPGYECINGGVGHFGPQNYSGFLKRFLYLKPDVFFVVIYTGNDFMDAICIEEFHRRLKTNKRPDDYVQKLTAANKIIDGNLAQAINQVYFFKTFPHLKDKALEITGKHLEMITKICKDNNIKLMVALLPTKTDIEPNTDAERIKAANEMLHLTDTDLAINRHLAISLATWLEMKEINYIDLYEYMKNRNVTLFWKKDHHLNTNGHALMADIIYSSFHF